MKTLPLLAAVLAVLLCAGCPQPDPPVPPPGPNPYPPPDAAMLDLVAPIAVLAIESDDGKALAAMYAGVALDAPDAEWDTAEFRAELIRRGRELGLQGKYPGLAEAVETVFDGSGLSKEVQPLDVPVAVACLESLAWAVWEASDG